MKKRSRNVWLAIAAAVLVLGVVGYSAYSLGTAGAKPRKSASTATSTATKGNTNSTDENGSGSPKAPDSASIALAEYSNSRFGFRVGYPQGWQLIQSQNGDGATVSASEGKATIYIYGEPTSVFSLASLADAQTDTLKSQYGDVKTLERRETTVDDHPVLKILWQYTRNDQASSLTGSIKNLTLITIKGETAIKIECQMSAGDYEKLSSTAEAVLNSLKLK